MASPSVSTPAPSRRQFFGSAGAALTGVILGVPVYRAVGPNLTAVAEGWIEDANALGMYVLRGPDGKLWRGTAFDIPVERSDAQDRHWFNLNNRPRLLRAVYDIVEQGRSLTA